MSAAAESVVEDADLGRPVRIRWIDSGGHDNRAWAPRTEFMAAVELDDMVCETVGLWMGENDTVIAIAQTRDAHNGNWLSVQVIWKPALILKEYLG